MLLSHRAKDWIGAVCWIVSLMLSYVGIVLLYHLAAGRTLV